MVTLAGRQAGRWTPVGWRWLWLRSRQQAVQAHGGFKKPSPPAYAGEWPQLPVAGHASAR